MPWGKCVSKPRHNRKPRHRAQTQTAVNKSVTTSIEYSHHTGSVAQAYSDAGEETPSLWLSAHRQLACWLAPILGSNLSDRIAGCLLVDPGGEFRRDRDRRSADYVECSRQGTPSDHGDRLYLDRVAAANLPRRRSGQGIWNGQHPSDSEEDGPRMVNKARDGQHRLGFQEAQERKSPRPSGRGLPQLSRGYTDSCSLSFRVPSATFARACRGRRFRLRSGWTPDQT